MSAGAGSAPALRVYRMVLTGGPCGGKSSALPRIAEALRARGVPTVTLPEMATSLVDAGIDRVAMIASEPGLFDFNRLCVFAAHCTVLRLLLPASRQPVPAV
jgi:predicted ATPase